MVAAVPKPSPSPDRHTEGKLSTSSGLPKTYLLNLNQNWCLGFLVRVKAVGLNRAGLRARAGPLPAKDQLNIFREE